MKPKIAIFFLVLGLVSTSMLKAGSEPKSSLRLDVIGGNLDGSSLYGAVGRYSSPIWEPLEIQLELSGGALSSDSLWGVNTHLFSRNETWLLGILGTVSQLAGDIERYQVGLEVERYFEGITLSASGGWQKQNDGLASFYGGEDEAGFVVGLIRWYPDDNLLAEGGLTLEDVNIRFHVGLEKQLLLTIFQGTLSGFVDLVAGENDYESIVGGIRYRFGKQESLKAYHRENGILPIRN